MAIYGVSYPKFKLDDLITNGGFDTDSGWNKHTGWTIAGGVAHCDGTDAGGINLWQTSTSFETGKTYLVTFTVSNYVDGTLKAYVGGFDVGTARTADGTYAELITVVNPSNDGNFYFQGRENFEADVDNVSVEEVVELNNSIIKPTWRIPQVIKHKSILTGVINYIQISADKAQFDVIVHIWKYAVPKTTMQLILSHNHTLVKFMPHEDEGNYLTTDGETEADFYISLMRPFGISDKPPILQDKLLIRFESLGSIFMPLATQSFLVDEGGDFLVDEGGGKLIKEEINPITDN